MEQQAVAKLEKRCSARLTMECKLSHCPSYSEETAAIPSAFGYAAPFIWGMYFLPVSREKTIAVCSRYDITKPADSL